MATEMTDEQLLNYVWYHSKTERALFHGDHINRVLELAGDERRVPGWREWHAEYAQPVVTIARAKLKEKANARRD